MATLVSFGVLSIAVVTAGGCARREPAPSQASASAVPRQATATLERVNDRSLVCMVNNHFMGRPQIPVVVAGNTYYGCCAMCKEKLGNDPAARTATDPVSNKPVDKAVAVIGKTETGAALYFENESNFAKYTGGG
jgi:YHS domain-containing protein